MRSHSPSTQPGPGKKPQAPPLCLHITSQCASPLHGELPGRDADLGNLRSRQDQQCHLMCHRNPGANLV